MMRSKYMEIGVQKVTRKYQYWVEGAALLYGWPKMRGVARKSLLSSFLKVQGRMAISKVDIKSFR